MEYLSLSGVSKGFEGKCALQISSLNFPKSALTAVLGPSGCGKTTLLNLLSGILVPDSGTIFLDGKDITFVPPEERQFGIVFQHYALFPHLSVWGNITYGLRGRRWDTQSRKKRGVQLLEMMRLAGFEKLLPAALSGGQQQRVALARALAPEPSILLLDEPLSALDAQVRDLLGRELLRIQRATGITTIMVTHDQQEALALADHIVLLHDGKVQQIGTPQDLYVQPASVFAGNFVGHMNMLDMPQLGPGKAVGIRYEDVIVREPSELVLECPYTFVARIEHRAFMGAFVRLDMLLNDFSTYVTADVPLAIVTPAMQEHALVAVTLPAEAWHTW